ncbi:MAG: hypothetical protein U0871_24295 [Gemmataceae bacterium]
MCQMLTLIKALAPDTATITDYPAHQAIHVTGRWAGWDGPVVLGFTLEPSGKWSVLATADGIGAKARRLRPFHPSEVGRLQRFFADPLRWFLRKGVVL